jgi:WD40 repeat protein/uncharacterized caspase-like protein
MSVTCVLRKRRFGRLAAVLATLLSLPYVPAIAAEVLPGESVLPGEWPPAATATTVQLPAESLLPAALQSQVAAPQSPPAMPAKPEQPPAEQAPHEPTGAGPAGAIAAGTPVLPSELILPATWVAAAEQAPEQAAPAKEEAGKADGQAPAALNLAQSVDAIPWLRLNLAGHVAPVRAMAFTRDSQRLCSAGEDKSMLVWQRGSDDAFHPDWRHERSVFWQVQRGNSGRIHALAIRENLVAIGGHGAMGGLGEILLLDAITGNLRAALYDERIGHRQVIVSLAFSPDPKREGLASQDRDGRVLFWRPETGTGLWKATQIQATDVDHYGTEIAKKLYPYRGTSPVVMTDADHVVFPVHAVDPRNPNLVAWQLQTTHVDSGEKLLVAGQKEVFHLGFVTALAAAADGSSMASADAAQLKTKQAHRFFVWDLHGGAVENRVPRVPLSLAYSGDGKTLAVGTAESQGQSSVEIWNVSDVRQPRRTELEIASRNNVSACAMSADGKCCAYADGSDVIVLPLADSKLAARLQAGIRPALRVAFAQKEPLYRLAFGSERTGDAVPLQHVFDTDRVQIDEASRIDESDWVPENADSQDWSLEVQRDARTATESFRLSERGEPRCKIPLDPNSQGSPSAWAWIPDAEGRPLAVAVGTSGSGNIYVFRLTGKDECPILQVFRGHSGRVTSLSVSRDHRYLSSASTDATIRVWPLRDWLHDSATMQRWGAEFENQSGQLVVGSIREDGPVYFRGIRRGDAIQRLRWSAGLDAQGNVQYQSSDEPEAMLRSLRELPWDTMVAFEYVRGREPARPFQIFPAWQPLVSLVVAESREWAFWAPSGYYDASFEGHKLFGWQVNRGLQLLPDFFLAAQLRKALERPEVMSRLLRAGSLDAAFRAARNDAPVQPQRAVIDAYYEKPAVKILTPEAGQTVDGETVRVTATVTIRNGQRLVPPKAFVSGVVAPRRVLVDEQAIPGGRTLTYQWDARLPSDSRILLQVIASTDAEIAGAASLSFPHKAAASSRVPRLFVVSAGIDHYRDAQIPRLDYAVNNSAQFAVTLRDRARPLYGAEILSIVNDDVTRPVWKTTLQHYADQLRERVNPDDMLVFFLSGHGVSDPEIDKYYYVTANARYLDVTGRQFGDCLSFEDFSAFADVPCRKLVILDTCHSGAVSPLGQRELKTALRALQNDIMFTLTASEGGQEAVEERERRLGRFTHRLLEALRGEADQQDGNRDGVVRWSEVVNYVKRTVAADSASQEQRQFPTAGPLELVGVADYPLARVTPPEPAR